LHCFENGETEIETESSFRLALGRINHHKDIHTPPSSRGGNWVQQAIENSSSKHVSSAFTTIRMQNRFSHSIRWSGGTDPACPRSAEKWQIIEAAIVH
jgi:hypothetical protein